MILSAYFVFLHFFQVFKEMSCVHEVGPNSDFTGLSILSRGEDKLSNLHACYHHYVIYRFRRSDTSHRLYFSNFKSK